jgi:hypothetical protein
VIATITLTGTLSCLKTFGTTIVIVVGLVQNIFLTFVFLGQLDAQCQELEQIIHGYLKGTLAGLTGCVVTLATSLTILMGTIGMIGFFLFLL